MGKIPRQEQQNEAGLCQEQDRRGRKQLQSRKASEKETVGTRRSGQCPGEASETGRAASLIQCWMSRKTAAGAYHTFYGMFAVTCSVRLRSPYRRDS